MENKIDNLFVSPFRIYKYSELIFVVKCEAKFVFLPCLYCQPSYIDVLTLEKAAEYLILTGWISAWS